MLEGIFSSEIYQVLQKSLNAASLQHQIISNNIANVDTPGFKRSEVVFQNKLEQVLGLQEKNYLPLTLTHKNHIPVVPELTIDKINPEIVTKTETSLRTDKNNVDIDFEMSRMAENTAYYSSIAQLTSLKLKELISAITEGRR
ncbi:MAG TPA: flagellar basal body rod protein FlgB [Candidatus Goldiibacteriota bacterium]|nr:flagellar basal body rod protein FlgB [Candidatus Goldiibacteriota bacterium]